MLYGYKHFVLCFCFNVSCFVFSADCEPDLRLHGMSLMGSVLVVNNGYFSNTPRGTTSCGFNVLVNSYRNVRCRLSIDLYLRE